MIDEEESESSDQRHGGRLGLAGGRRALTIEVRRASAGPSGHTVRIPGLAHRVHSIVDRAMAGENADLAGGHLQPRVRCRLGLSGSRHGHNPVTRWPGLHPTQVHVSFIICTPDYM